MALSDEQIGRYREDGSLVLRGILSEQRIENGCLYVLPGSHVGPALDHTENGIFVGAVPAGSFDSDGVEPLVLEPGDISIHHVRLLHGSGPNRTDGKRRLLLQGYAAADAWPIMAQHQPSDWPEAEAS